MDPDSRDELLALAMVLAVSVVAVLVSNLFPRLAIVVQSLAGVIFVIFLALLVVRSSRPDARRTPFSLITIIRVCLVSIFGLWSRFRLGVPLGRNLGLITERLSDLDLSEALPSYRPPLTIVDEGAYALAADSGPTERLRNANIWSAALETQLRKVGAPTGTVLTTFGFVRMEGEVRLAIVHYVRLRAAFAMSRPTAVELMGWRFPVVVRPWLASGHDGAPRASVSRSPDGNCWVKFLGEGGDRRPGILTARHAIRPENARQLDSVVVDVARPVPRGRLQHESSKMDAAVIWIEESEWGSKTHTPHSKVVGYKPVRFVTGHGTTDADVVEHSGFLGATIPGQFGQEPLNGAFMILNKSLSYGDSGCLVVDLEFAAHLAPRPYLIYLGATVLSWGGKAGYALFIEQANRVWNLECYID